MRIRKKARYESETCIDDDEVLAAYENRLGFSSIRAFHVIQECELLKTGTDPLEIEDHHLVDDVLATFFNQNYEIQIGQTIYYVPNEFLTYTIENADLLAIYGPSKMGRTRMTMRM